MRCGSSSCFPHGNKEEIRMGLKFCMYGKVLCAVLLLAACGGSTYTLGGTVTGLVGTVVLQNNGTSDLSISANGPFTFAGRLTGGSTYNVTVSANRQTRPVAYLPAAVR